MLIAHLFRTSCQHFVVVITWQTRNTVGTRGAHLVLGTSVIRVHLIQRDRPVEQVSATDFTVNRACFELVLLEAQGSARPVRCRSTHCLHDPCRQIREVIRHTPSTRGSTLVEPGNLAEHRPLVVLEIIDLVTTAGLENHDIDSLLR